MKWLWRFIGGLRRGLVLVVLLAMLAFNVASFAVDGLTDVMSGVAKAVFGRSAVAVLSQQVTTLKERNTTLKERNTTLETGNKQLVRRNTTLDRENRQLVRRNITLGDNLQANRARVREARSNADNATRRIAQRAIRGAGRNVAAVPLEAVPVVGVATVVAVTALDVKEACDTLHDMQDLRVAAGIDAERQDWTSQVCGTFSQQSVPAVCDMTIPECRDHAVEVRAELGDEMGDEINRQCDALMEPDPELCREPDSKDREIPPPER